MPVWCRAGQRDRQMQDSDTEYSGHLPVCPSCRVQMYGDGVKDESRTHMLGNGYRCPECDEVREPEWEPKRNFKEGSK